MRTCIHFQGLRSFSWTEKNVTPNGLERDWQKLTLQIHGGRKHGGSMDILNMRSSTHNSTLGTCGTRMVNTHWARCSWVIRSGHRSSCGSVPVRSLRHLTAGSQIAVGTRHVTQPSWVHGGTLQATRVKTRLIQIRVVHIWIQYKIPIRNLAEIDSQNKNPFP